MALQQTSYRGCLLGMAVGDAMGYTVDARSWQEIQEDYGPNGLLGYDLVNGYADVTSMDINKAIQRSLTKACARHGLGLYIYAGEDLPDGEESPAQPQQTPKKSVRDEIARIKAKYGLDGFKQMRESLIAGGVVKNIPSEQMTEADWWELIVAIDQNFGDAA